ncbi:Protein fem-1 like protein C [Habropoda laboriosa]|uniref:Protein fem-1 like protein C n=1 Tax=Habropoda laboriosa TaxID=597456 RepID=A0A0L7QKV1_9HYME|nr:Protein fem-1 like protein C [Habropoda laboriosa]
MLKEYDDSPTGVDCELLFCILMEECKHVSPEGHLSIELRNSLERHKTTVRKKIVSELQNGCAPLFIACNRGIVEIVKYLITVCHADIEQKGRYEIPDDRSVHYVTPLWCAAVSGKLPVVKWLVYYGAKVNELSDSGSTAVRSACFMSYIDVVKYLVENGADILIPNFSGGTCLINSIQTVELCSFLICSGADVNATDIQNKTALHYAVQEHRLETTKLLLKHNADPYLRSRYNDDALQTACLKAAIEIFEYLVETIPYTPERLADAHELMGATCFDDNNNTQNALKFWRTALDIRSANAVNGVPLPKRPVLPKREIYKNATEFTTIEELNEIALDLDATRIQCLLICERILGPHHKDTLFRLMFRGALYADAFMYQNCIDLWHRALEIRVEKDSILHADTCYTARALIRLMVELNEKTLEAVDHNQDKEKPRFCDVVAIFKLLTSQLIEAKELLEKRPVHKRQRESYERILKCVTYLIYLLVQTGTSDEEKALTRKLVRNLVKQDPRSAYTEDTLLHFCVWKTNTVSSTIFPHLEVVRLLLECGANVNARNEWRSTPLHIASDPYNFQNSIVKLLLDYGAHLDIPNKARITPLQLISSNSMNTVNLMKYITLRCYAAQAILKYGIRCRTDTDVPETLYQFVESHRE